MRNISLNQFYKKIKNKIALVGGYIEDKSICHIIKSCRLKPITIFSNHFSFDTSLETIWVDEESSHIIEIKKKKAKIQPCTASVPHISTDLFKNETNEFIINHSKFACIGLFPDTTNFILLLMGTDNYFRCYDCVDDTVTYRTPLIVGLKILKHCVNMKPITYFKKLTIKSELKELDKVEWFITTLPASKLFLPNIVTCNKLRSILYNE